MNWKTGIPKLNQTSGKSKILICKAVWENITYYVFAFYNENTKEWIDINTRKPVQVIGWKEIE